MINQIKTDLRSMAKCVQHLKDKLHILGLDSSKSINFIKFEVLNSEIVLNLNSVSVDDTSHKAVKSAALNFELATNFYVMYDKSTEWTEVSWCWDTNVMVLYPIQEKV